MFVTPSHCAFASDILLDCRLTRAPRFRQLLALGMIFDEDEAWSALGAMAEARDAWRRGNVPWSWLNETERGRAICELFIEIMSGILVEDEAGNEAERWLGYSSGYDSRFIHHALRVLGAPPKIFTFGQAGNADFDFARLSATRGVIEPQLIDTSEIEWRLEDFDRNMPATLDYSPSPRVPSARIVAGNGAFVEFHGYLNDALTGSHEPKETLEEGWDAALDHFLKKNDAFRLHRFIDPAALRRLMPERLPDCGLPDHVALDLAYRQHQRIRPLDNDRVSYRLPFTDRRWAGLWLNMPPDELRGQSRYLKTLAGLDGPEFFDLREMKARSLPFSRAARLELLYGPEGAERTERAERERKVAPSGATSHFDSHACYRNNPSFRQMVDTSLSRARGRGVFRKSFIDETLRLFGEGERDAASMILGIVTIDSCLESGVLST